jgi:hypothetical protein
MKLPLLAAVLLFVGVEVQVTSSPLVIASAPLPDW